ncbi:hypothetical protein EMGBS15_10610 [Filimonas sp.]|nr:hypothetical protein EMGBS15_10610 [Filimonas sp.]
MEKVFAKAEELAGNLKNYVNARIDEVKFEAAEKTSALLANLLAGLIVSLIFLFFIGFASVAIAICLGNWIGHLWAGYLCVAVFYLLAGIIVWIGREKLIRLPIMNSLIRQLFGTHEED